MVDSLPRPAADSAHLAARTLRTFALQQRSLCRSSALLERRGCSVLPERVSASCTYDDRELHCASWIRGKSLQCRIAHATGSISRTCGLCCLAIACAAILSAHILSSATRSPTRPSASAMVCDGRPAARPIKRRPKDKQVSAGSGRTDACRGSILVLPRQTTYSIDDFSTGR